MTSLAWFSRGVPEAQGSIRPLPKRGKRLKGAMFADVILTSDNADLKTWRAIVRADAIITRARELGGAGLRGIHWPDGPVDVRLNFMLPRPVTRPKTVPADVWQLGAVIPHVTRPDIDKLARAILDALTGVLWTDDGQVQTCQLGKFIAAPGGLAGVEITARSAQ